MNSNNVSIAKIVKYSEADQPLCASAARISTTAGNSLEIFQKSMEPDQLAEGNSKLIRRVLSSGHKSFLEHAVFTIAFCNVSVFIEQFMIEFRLASYTVKSRRYVDFGSMGYYIPSDLEGRQLDLYKSQMDARFSQYSHFLEMGVPKEDARFLLPYCFYSNFYCTVNARELIHILREMLYGRGREFDEITALARQLLTQLREIFPAAAEEVTPYETGYQGISVPCAQEEDGLCMTSCSVEMLEAPHDPMGRLLSAYFVSRGERYTGSNLPTMDEDALIGSFISSDRPRELEHVSYTFLIRDISLSAITHLVRHRMQSLSVPPLTAVRRGRFMVPETVKKDARLLEEYRKAFQSEAEAARAFQDAGGRKEHLVYFNLAGNVLDVLTTLNAREMLVFFKLRCCSRAQWEIHNVADAMLKEARSSFPQLFSRMGPSCLTDGRCPEGRLSCGNMEEVLKKYRIE